MPDADADAQAVPPGRADIALGRLVGSAGTGATDTRGQKEHGRGQAGHGRSKGNSKAPRKTHPGKKERRDRDATLGKKPASKGGAKKVQPRKTSGALREAEAPKRSLRVAAVLVANSALKKRLARIEVAAYIVQPP